MNTLTHSNDLLHLSFSGLYSIACSFDLDHARMVVYPVNDSEGNRIVMRQSLHARLTIKITEHFMVARYDVKKR